MHLHEWQNQFTRAITHRDITEVFSQDIRPGGTLSHAQEALEIYARAYVARLTESLGETFEGVWSVLGDHRFFVLARDYIQAHPSQSYNLSDYGDQFPEHLPIDEFPFLKDLARFEWLFKQIFHAPSPESHSHSGEFTENSLLTFHPSVEVFQSHYPVYAIWQKRKTQDFPKAIFGKEHLLLYKSSDGRIWVKDLPIWEYELLLLLKQGTSLGVALEKIVETHSISDPFQVQRVFSEISSLLL